MVTRSIALSSMLALAPLTVAGFQAVPTVCSVLTATVHYTWGEGINDRVNIGDTLTGTLTYPREKRDWPVSRASAGFYRYDRPPAPIGVVLNINGLVFRTYPKDPGSRVWLSVVNDRTFVSEGQKYARDEFGFTSLNNHYDIITSHELDNYISIYLTDSTATIFDSQIPPAPLPPRQWWDPPTSRGDIEIQNYYHDMEYFEISANITSIESCNPPGPLL